MSLTSDQRDASQSLRHTLRSKPWYRSLGWDVPTVKGSLPALLVYVTDLDKASAFLPQSWEGYPLKLQKVAQRQGRRPPRC